MAVLVLQALAIECGTPGCSTQKEAASHHVSAGPNHVPHALKAKHGIENVKRNGGNTVNRIGGAGRHERSHGAGFTNALLQDLAIPGLAV